MRRTKEEAQQTRKHLLDAALTVFSQKGYDATRLEDVAESAKVTRGAVYHHFDGKAGLFMSLIEDASHQGSQVIQAAIAEGGSFTELVARVMSRTLSLVEEDLRFRDVMALSLFKTGDSLELAEFKRMRYDQARSQVEEIAGLFQAGISQGALRPDLDPFIAARAFLALQNGIISLWLTNPQAFSIRQNAEQFGDLFLRGIV